MMAHELSNGVSNWKSGSKQRLQQMFPADEEEDGVKSFTKSYHKYKRQYVKHLSFNPKEENLSKCVLLRLAMFNVHLFPASVLEHAPLQEVYIYFDTATYDEIERDEKVSFSNSCMYLITVLILIYNTL